MRAATVVQVLQDLFYVLLQLLVIAAIILSFEFYCMFTACFILLVIAPLRSIRLVPRDNYQTEAYGRHNQLATLELHPLCLLDDPQLILVQLRVGS